MKNIIELNTLVLDDEIISAEVIKTDLKNYTHSNEDTTYTLNILYEGSSLNAIDELSTGRYDLAILDYKMPIKDGLEVAKAVKKKDSLIPLIMVSTYDIPEKDLAEAGVEYFSCGNCKRLIWNC